MCKIEKKKETIMTVEVIPFDQPDPDLVHPTGAAYLVMDRARNPVVPPVPELPPAPSMLIGHQEPVAVGIVHWMGQLYRRIATNQSITSGISAGLILFEPEPPLEPDEDLEPPFHVLQVESVVRRRSAAYRVPLMGTEVPRHIQYATIGRNAVVVLYDPADSSQSVVRRITPIVAASVGGGEDMPNIANTKLQEEAPQSLGQAVSRGFRQRNKVDWWD